MRMIYQSAIRECSLRMSHVNALKECRMRMFYKTVACECFTCRVNNHIPVLLKSAQSLSLFLTLLSECFGNAFFISSIFIRRGLSGLFQNSR